MRTMFNHYYAGSVETHREYFTYADGGKGVIDYMSGYFESDRPLVIMVPGIMSTMDDNYIRTLTRDLEIAGYSWAMLHYRGIGTNMTTE